LPVMVLTFDSGEVLLSNDMSRGTV